jgi:molybdate transport system ATP-binding protein
MLIHLDDISIQVNNHVCFENTSWNIKKGQNWAILGQNGSGKSTLAKAIARKLNLLHGQIWYHFDAEEERPYLKPREILTLSPETHRDFLQQYADYHQARWQSFEGDEVPTVSQLLSAENIERISPFEVSSHKIDEQAYAQKRAEVIDLFKLDYLLGRKIIHVSHGESRKVFIARLLMQSPRLLILDDAYSGLDSESRERLSSGIEALINRCSPQILFITSRPEDIPAGIDHYLVVENNHILAQGNRQEIFNNKALEPLLTSSLKSSAHKHFQKTAVFDSLVESYIAALKTKPVIPDTALIKMHHVSVVYGNVEVLKNITWTVNPGERWVLSGHNGAGKTTLLSLILADNPQSYKNDIYLFGQKRGSGESIWEIKQNMGLVSPELHIYYRKTATCRDVICSGFFDSVGLYTLCTPAQIEIAEKWLKALDMVSLGAAPFYSLSTGQQRLVLLARALVKNPPLLVLDEPCQALDDDHRRFILELLDQICAHTPITLLYVTHYQGEIPNAITHQLSLDHGTITHNGPRA